MSICLHYIRRITIVQSNKVLYSFSDVLFCNYSHNTVVTTAEVVFSPVIYSWYYVILINKIGGGSVKQ
jgi:hypothetical protein